MDHSEYDENVPHFGSNSQTINDNNKELSYETPEQRVATNISQQVFASNLFESQTQPKQEESEAEMGRHSAPVDVFGQHLSQTIGKPIEQRFSGRQQEYDAYEYEEEDEEDDSDDSLERQQTGSRPNIGSDLMFSSSPNTNQPSTDPFIETGVRPKEEVLYQLSEDSNVLRAQNYGIGSGLRIDSQNDQNSGNVSVYSLNSEDPFQTPEKKVDQNRQMAEEKYEEFMRREEPFETMSTDFGISSNDKTDNLLEFDINSSELSANVKPISHNIDVIESNRNHSQSSGESESEDEIIVTSSGVSTLPTHTFAETVSLSPNLDETQAVDTQNTLKTDSAFTQHSIKESTLVSDERKTLHQKPLDIQQFGRNTTKEDKPFQHKSDHIMANKKELQESSSNASDTTTGSGSSCPFGPIAELVYWRNPKKSGIVFGSGLVILLSLTFFSIISVVAYASLAALSVTLSFRIYKNILQAVQKTNEGHPFKEYLELEITPSTERIHQIVDSVMTQLNCTINKLRSVFLVEDIIDSLKFVVLFWCLTYIGSWFNGLTLIILAYLAVFSLPKVYEMNKTQIDHYLNLASTQIHEITSKVRAKIPFPAKKEKDN